MRIFKGRSFDFNKNLPKYLIFSGAIMLIGIAMIFVSGIKLDIVFGGGTNMQFSYTGDIDNDALRNAIQSSTGIDVTVTTSTNFTNSSQEIDIDFVSNQAASLDLQEKIIAIVKETCPDNNIGTPAVQSVSPSVGFSFFMKSLYAMGIAGLLVVVYVGIRFRKIGGISAGVTALIALVHDILVAFFACVIFGLPIGTDFVAVVLTILGYSLNDTIVIYDRVRENRKIYGSKMSISENINSSINQMLDRSLTTALATFLAIFTVVVVALLLNIDSLLNFALPMSIGVLSGSYSTICLSGPIWVKWQERKLAKAVANNKKKKK